jgi:rhomboid protease GluP
MKHFSDRLQVLILPYILLTLLFTGGYTFLNWFLCIYTKWVAIKEMYIDFIFPMLIAFLLVYFIIRPRLHILQLAPGKDTFGIQMLVGISMFAPTAIAQNYIDKATGTLTEVHRILDISKLPESKYYDVGLFYLDTTHVGMYKTSSVSGKHSQHFNFELYIAIPMFNTAKDMNGFACKYWIGEYYSKQISNSLSSDEKSRLANVFLKESERQFRTTNFSNFTYLEKFRESEELEGYEAAIARGFYADSKDVIVFTRHQEAFESRLGTTFEWIFYSWGIGSLVVFLIFLFVKLNPTRIAKYKKGTLKTKSDLEDFLILLIPRKDFLITPILIHLNVLIFLLLFFFGYGFMHVKGVDLLRFGASFKPLVSQGEIWRLLSSIFLHGGFLHLLMNMFALFFAGLFLEPLLGKWRLLSLYVFTGIVASIASFMWYDATISVGASGAIFGLYGYFIAAIIYQSFPYKIDTGFLYSLLAYIGINLVMGLIGSGGIDNAAHIGGLVSGFCYGVLFPVSKK